tara:strand:+ start:2004 stop:3563 length:1560 start_codon:yes stop_codon:yes gene_type:complete
MHNLLIVPPASIRSFEQDLLSTTALTPTHHKGGIGKVLGIVAAIAIPFAAPAIASSIGISAALGSATLGSALVGAGLGAATAAITGQNPLMGAAMGGIGGGIAGYNYAPVGIDPVSGLQNLAPGANVNDPTFGLGGTGVPTSVGVQSGIGTGSDVGLQDLRPGMNPDDPTYGLSSVSGANPGSQLSGTGLRQVNYSPTMDARAYAESQSYAGGNFAMDEHGRYINLTTGDVVPTNTTVYGQPAVRDLSTNMPTATIPSGTSLSGVNSAGYAGIDDIQRAAQLGTSYTPTIGDRFAGLLNNPMASIKGLPDYAKATGAKALTQGLTHLLGPSEPAITAAEQAALDQQARLTKLEEAKQLRNQALGDQYMQQARAINPEKVGFEHAAAATDRLKRAQYAGLRNLTGAQRTAAQRRAALDQARLGSTAFIQGRQAGLAERMARISSAAGTGANYSNLGTMASNDLATAQAYQKRLNQEQGNFANLATPLLAGGVFAYTDEERRAQAQRLNDQKKTIAGVSVS